MNAKSADVPPAGRLLPVLVWLRGYRLATLPSDLVAGVTLAAYLVPAAIGYASIAGLPPEAGLHACLYSGLVFWLFCSSRYTVITTTSALSILIGVSIGELSHGDPARHAALAAATALLVGALAFGAWLARAGVVVGFISSSVLVGFKSGVALYLVSSQLPRLFGFGGVEGDFWVQSHDFLRRLGSTNPVALAVGAAALALLLVGRRFWRSRPVALLVVVGGIAAAAFLPLEAHGVRVLGAVPLGLPAPHLPAASLHDLATLLPLAFACLLLATIETSSVGRVFGASHGARLDSNQEFLALASANLSSGLGHGFPVSGGLSQSLVNETAGASTPLSGFVAALVVLLTTLFLSGLLRHLPQPVLAAVVLAAVAHLIDVAELRRLWRADRREFLVAGTALLGVLFAGLLRGVLIGAMISLVQILVASSRPHVAVLGRIPGTRRFSDRERHPDNETVPGILVVRPEAGLLYYNSDFVHDQLMDRVRTQLTRPAVVLVDLSASPRIDLQAVDMLATLHDELSAAGTRLRLVEARSAVRDFLRSTGLEERVGRIDRFTTVADAVDDYARRQA
jgi:high affinity sulfate transporter 1